MNSSEGGGGLVIYPSLRADPDESFEEYNRQPQRMRAAVTAAKEDAVRVPFRLNRAVVFDSSFYHESDSGMDFGEAYGDARINLTLLFGRRGSQCERAA